MRITEVRELAVPLEGGVANAVVSFADHTVSLVALISDVMRGGRPVVGIAFNSIGRFAQGGILRERMIPRLLDAPPDALLDSSGERFDPEKVLATILRNEKPGGHGDRAGAAAAIEQAVWDLNGKLADEPAYVMIARAAGRTPAEGPVEVYTGGGYYYAPGSGQTLQQEFQRYRDMGFRRFKMKIGGASLAQDMKRVEEALLVAGGGQQLMVDANGRFDRVTALAYARELQPLDLRWFEEIGDPLDYQLNAEVIQAYGRPVATGENLFSAIDTLNLVRFGGMRPGRDFFQMDPGLSYGITEYLRILRTLESHGFDRLHAIPHGGHLINLHVVVGLGLGGCEAYPGVFQPFGGYSPQAEIREGRVWPGDAPGFGLEKKSELAPWIQRLLA
jgi:L-alanine-DL-glutamate epimerase-like enolase superfamily enzyme